MAGDWDRIRDEVREWLDANWDPDLELLTWRDRLLDSGWGCPTWPTEMFGRGLSSGEAEVVTAELARLGAPGPPAGAAMSLAAPTLLAMASSELKRRLLPAIVTGRNTWCQLFSEPGNGSDLAGLTTRADRDGDVWVVNGQKVWTTGAHRADYAMLLARTDWDAPKHRGITFFVIDMHQTGVEVRGIRQMNGHSSFNEVFLTDAHVAHDHVVGEVHGGWAAAMTTLAHERGLGPRAPRARNPVGRAAQQAAEEARAYNQTYVWYPQRSGRVDLAVPRALAAGRQDDPLVRQAVADLESLDRVATWTVARARAARARGRNPGPEGSVAKLTGSEIARRANAVHTTLAGAHGMLSDADAPEGGVVAEILVSTPAISIAGGTDEIQHDIVGERALGLPKGPSVDRDIPFREVRTNAVTRRPG
jgi:alkylation response protein AidB-like acyl-CoA dehydrogenase